MSLNLNEFDSTKFGTIESKKAVVEWIKKILTTGTVEFEPVAGIKFTYALTAAQKVLLQGFLGLLKTEASSEVTKW